MASDNYLIQDILHYARKTYKNNRNGTTAFSSGRRDDINEISESPRNDRVTAEAASCSCDIDTEAEIANILHKKCPIIALAQQQLQRLSDETDQLLRDNTRHCRSIYDIYLLCKEILWNQNKCQCALIFLILLCFVVGLLIGAASCGTNLRKFNSPILSCIDEFFISDTHLTLDDSFHSIIA